jgi:hypothetical protein
VNALVAATALSAAVLAAALGGCHADAEKIHAATTEPSRQHSSRAVVWAVGDAGWQSAGGRRLAQTVRSPRPDRMLFLGDVYDHGTAADFARNYDPLWGRLAAITEPTSGNHDWPNRRTGYDPYWRAKKGRAYPRWSRFSIGGWEVLDLNSEAPHQRGSPQLRWLARALRAPGNCRIAFWHRPRFSAGLHGDQSDMAPVYSALSGHASAVISGHDHDLQRLRRREGLVQYVAGAGGRGRYKIDDGYPGLAWGRDDVDGALRIVLKPGHAAFEFTDADGHLLDRSRVSCSPG